MSSGNARKSSLVDYSKVSNQPDARVATVAPNVALAPPSAQMDAVLRMMTGREERTIAEKLADSNRPTWEQYKKDHHDKLHFDTLDQKKMEEYRQTLDEERDRRMAGLPPSRQQENKKAQKLKEKKKKKHSKDKRRRPSSRSSSDSSLDSDSDEKSSSEDESRRRHKKRQKRRHKRKHDDSDNDDRKSKKREKKSKRTRGNDDSV